MNRSILPGLLIVGAFLFTTEPVFGASLYIDPSSASIKRGDSITLSVRVDTDEASGECINAVSAVITYGDRIEPVDISTGESILSIWVEDPIIDKDKRQITFAGGIPNGYCGRIQGDPRLTNNIVDLVFRSPGFLIGSKGEDIPEVQISFTDETQVFLNDGFGTKATLNTYGSTITLLSETGGGANDEWLGRVAEDDRPPEEFSITLTREENSTTFGGKWFIVFNTDDKQTGIDHYEVMEESFAERGLFRWGAADAPWREARSPYVLQDQTLNSTIRVKAIDKAGNVYIATYVPDWSLRSTTKEQYITIALGVVGFLVLVGAVLFTYVFWRRRKAEAEGEIEDHERYE